MVLDEARLYKWVLFQKTLFKKHPVRYPTYGTVRDVSNMTRAKLVDYYSEHYIPQNMIISVVGDVDNIKPKVECAFFSKSKKANPVGKIYEPPQNEVYSASETRETMSSYIVLGYPTCSRSHKDSYAIDILEAIYGRGQSGRMFEEIRNKEGLAYEVGIINDLQKDVGIFGVHASTDKRKVKQTEKIMLREFFKPVTKKEVENAQSFIEGNYTIKNEGTHDHADELCFWENADRAEISQSYLTRIKKITFAEVLHVQKKYFTKNYTVAIVGPK